MKNYAVWMVFTGLALVLSGCKPMSIAIKGDDCKMNGSFETTKKDLPVNWCYYAPQTVPNGDFNIQLDHSVFKEGKTSLRFQVRQCESIGGRFSPGFFKSFKVKPGETYIVSFWVLNSGCTFKVYAQTGMKGNSGINETIVQTRESFSTWRYFEHAIKIPMNNDNLRFEANILTPGTLWFDDIRIEGVNDNEERTIYPYRGDEECK